MATDWTAELYNIGYEEAIEDVTEFLRGYDQRVYVADLLEHLEHLVAWEVDVAAPVEAEFEEILNGPTGYNPTNREERYLLAGDPDETDDDYATLRSLRGRTPDAI